MRGFAWRNSVLMISRRELFSACVALSMALVGSAWLADSEARAAAKPQYSVAMTPSSTVAGSTGNSYTFTFTALDVSQSRVSVTVPGGSGGASWTAPQSVNPAGAGYVSVAKQTCNSAVVASISAGSIFVDTKCAKGRQFTLTYGAGTGAKVIAPTQAGPYTFTSKVQVGGSFLNVAAQPAVTVRPGPTSRLFMSELADAVGAAQDVTVTAQDEFGNTTPDYRGTVKFAGSGPPAAWVLDIELFPGWNRFNGFTLPGQYTFAASDAGVHSFPGGVKMIFAGEQTVKVLDTQDAGIAGERKVTISPGPMAGFDVLAPVLSQSRRLHIVDAQVPKMRLTIAAFDVWGNIATRFNGRLDMTFSAAANDVVPGDLPDFLDLVDGTASYDVTWPHTADGDVIVLIRGKFGGGAFAKTFTRPVEIEVTKPDLNALAFTIPPPTPGAEVGHVLVVPNQNVTIAGSLLITSIETPVANGPIVANVTGTTTTGIPLNTTLTLSDPVLASGQIVDTTYEPPVGGQQANIVDSATGQQVLAVGTELTITSEIAGGPGPFGPVTTVYPNSAQVTATTDGRNQTMAIFDLSAFRCADGHTWSPTLTACV